MAWQFWRRNNADPSVDGEAALSPSGPDAEASAEQGTAGPDPSSETPVDTGTLPSPPASIFRKKDSVGAWQTLPPIAPVTLQRSTAKDLFTANPTFYATIATQQDVTLARKPMGHEVSPTAPVGTVLNLATTVGSESAAVPSATHHVSPADLVLRPLQRTPEPSVKPIARRVDQPVSLLVQPPAIPAVADPSPAAVPALAPSAEVPAFGPPADIPETSFAETTPMSTGAVDLPAAAPRPLRAVEPTEPISSLTNAPPLVSAPQVQRTEDATPSGMAPLPLATNAGVPRRRIAYEVPAANERGTATNAPEPEDDASAATPTPVMRLPDPVAGPAPSWAAALPTSFSADDSARPRRHMGQMLREVTTDTASSDAAASDAAGGEAPPVTGTARSRPVGLGAPLTSLPSSALLRNADDDDHVSDARSHTNEPDLTLREQGLREQGSAESDGASAAEALASTTLATIAGPSGEAGDDNNPPIVGLTGEVHRQVTFDPAPGLDLLSLDPSDTADASGATANRLEHRASTRVEPSSAIGDVTPPNGGGADMARVADPAAATEAESAVGLVAVPLAPSESDTGPVPAASAASVTSISGPDANVAGSPSFGPETLPGEARVAPMVGTAGISRVADESDFERDGVVADRGGEQGAPSPSASPIVHRRSNGPSMPNMTAESARPSASPGSLGSLGSLVAGSGAGPASSSATSPSVEIPTVAPATGSAGQAADEAAPFVARAMESQSLVAASATAPSETAPTVGVTEAIDRLADASVETTVTDGSPASYARVVTGADLVLRQPDSVATPALGSQAPLTASTIGPAAETPIISRRAFAGTSSGLGAATFQQNPDGFTVAGGASSNLPPVLRSLVGGAIGHGFGPTPQSIGGLSASPAHATLGSISRTSDGGMAMNPASPGPFPAAYGPSPRLASIPTALLSETAVSEPAGSVGVLHRAADRETDSGSASAPASERLSSVALTLAEPLVALQRSVSSSVLSGAADNDAYPGFVGSVQRAPADGPGEGAGPPPAAPSSADSASSGGGGGESGNESSEEAKKLDEMAAKLYDRIRYRIRRDLLNERERAGYSLDRVRR